jgi:primosomal protein N' (replication factor Y)
VSGILPFAGAESPAEPGSAFVSVAVERGIERAGQDGAELVYGVPAELLAGRPIEIGERVEVPLGRKRVGGTVVSVGGPELAGALEIGRVRAITRRTGTSVPRRLVELARWIAAYYVCPLGMALSATVPAAVKRQIGRASEEVLAPGDFHAAADLKGAVARAWEATRRLDPAVFPLPERELKGLLGEKTLRNIRALERLGVLKAQVREVIRSRDSSSDAARDAFGGDTTVRPTQGQQDVIDAVGADFTSSAPAFAVHLLHGITGSGKTEVYLRLIASLLSARSGAGAIVLVPEIALTPQTSERFTGRFGTSRVAVLHSGLSAARRHSEWARVASGEARVVVGARSAVFAPMEAVGLIIVDEEHDGSYKQDRLPRYHARDAAVKRAQMEGCPVVLGSATPSLESWANATGERAKYRLWRLPERVGGGSLPRVTVVDLYRERQEARRLGLGDATLGPTLRTALFETIREGMQAILLLNRRGYATYVGCAGGAACGWVMTCDRCDARMILHRDASLRAGELLRCHHCLSECLVPRACPACSRGLVRLGAGTQRVEEELLPLLAELSLPKECMLRIDRDTMRTANDYFEALESFARGRARLLLGTQMIAKGLDFPGVRLVGVVSADTGLYLPDFRAGERTFQLISQVAGRAGRADELGVVIVQTMEPQNPAIVRAAAHDFEGFARDELFIRRKFGLPPFSRMARIICRDAKSAPLRERAKVLAAFFQEWARHHAGELCVRGPLDPALTRIADHYRIAIELLGPRAGTIQDALHAARAQGLLKSDSKTAVDVDPVSLL